MLHMMLMDGNLRGREVEVEESFISTTNATQVSSELGGDRYAIRGFPDDSYEDDSGVRHDRLGLMALLPKESLGLEAGYFCWPKYKDEILGTEFSVEYKLIFYFPEPVSITKITGYSRKLPLSSKYMEQATSVGKNNMRLCYSDDGVNFESTGRGISLPRSDDRYITFHGKESCGFHKYWAIGPSYPFYYKTAFTGMSLQNLQVHGVVKKNKTIYTEE